LYAAAIAKLSFNIIVGFAGLLIASAKASQPMIFLCFIGLVSPLLATGLAASGGMAVLIQLNKGAAWITNTATSASSLVLASTISKAIQK